MASQNSSKLGPSRPQHLPSPRGSPFPSPNISESSSDRHSPASYTKSIAGGRPQWSPSISSPTNNPRASSPADPASKFPSAAYPQKLHQRTTSAPYTEGQNYPRPLQRYENNFQSESMERVNAEPPSTRKGSYVDASKKTLGQKLKSIFVPRDEPKDPNCVRIESKHWTDE